MLNNLPKEAILAFDGDFKKNNPTSWEMMSLHEDFNRILQRCEKEGVEVKSYQEFAENKVFPGEYTDLIKKMEAIIPFKEPISIPWEGNENFEVSPFCPLIDPYAHLWAPKFILKNGKTYDVCQIRFGYLIAAHSLEIICSLEEVEKIV